MKSLKNLKENLPQGYEEILSNIENKLGISEGDELTDEQIDEICNFLSDNAPESTKHTLKIPSNVLEVPDEEYLKTMQDLNDKVDVTVKINPMTGLPDVNMTDETVNYADVDSITQTDIHSDIISEEDNIADLTDKLNISDSEATLIFNRILQMEKETLYDDAYDILPQSVKNIIDNNSVMIPDKSKNELANDFLRFLKQSLIKKPVYTDLQQIAAKQDPDVLDKYLNTIRNIMEDKMMQDADNETDKFKAKRLRECSKAFTSSYTYDFVKEYIEKKRVPLKVKGKRLTLLKELESDLSYYRTFCSRFSAKYVNSKFTINDITAVLPVLNRKLSIHEFDSDDNAMFVIILCKAFASKKVNNIVDHTLMYYTLKNIISLDGIDEETSEFGKTIIENIAETIRFIKKYKK